MTASPCALRKHAAFITAAFIICSSFIYLSIVQNMHWLSDENGWLENLQVATLALAMLVFGKNAWALASRHRSLCSFFAVLAFIFIMREVDFDKLAIPSWLIYLLAEQGRAIFYLLGFGFLFYEIAHCRYYWQRRKLYLRHSFFWYISTAAFVLIVFSTGFDKQIFDVPHHQLYEEVSEAFAYLMILAAAVFAKSSLSRCSEII